MAEPGSDPSGRAGERPAERAVRRAAEPAVVEADEFRNTGGGGALGNLTTATSVGRGKVTDSAPDSGG